MNSRDRLDRKHLLSELKRLSVKIAAPGEPLFKLKSGEMSRFYFDVKKTALHRLAHPMLARLLYAAFEKFPGVNTNYPSCVAGVVLGGCHLASITAMEGAVHHGVSLDVIQVRPEPKDHGTKQLVEAPVPADDADDGKVVVLFEDVVTTGGSSLKAIRALEEAGYKVVGIVAVIDRRVTPTKEVGGYPLQALFTLADFEDENLPQS